MDFAMFEKIANNSCSEEGIAARFYDRVVKTTEVGTNGLPKFKLVCFCEIRIKDNNSEVYDQPATDDKIRRFPMEYARYQLGKKQVVDGTPLEQFAFLNRAEVETLKVHGIFTVETLAALAEDKAIQLGIVDERKLAEKFLQQAKNNLSLKQWQKKEEEYVARIKYLEEQIAELEHERLSKTSENEMDYNEKIRFVPEEKETCESEVQGWKSGDAVAENETAGAGTMKKKSGVRKAQKSSSLCRETGDAVAENKTAGTGTMKKKSGVRKAQKSEIKKKEGKRK